MADVSLTSGMRANLLQLQMTERLMDRTQGRIATGKKVNSALDGPAAYFAAKALSDRAADLSGLKDNMGQAISTIKAADAAISKITSLVEQARAVANTANQNLGTDTASVASRKTSAAQYDTLLKQIDQMVTDASYAGKNLLLGVGGSGPYTATTDSVTAVDALTQISSTSVSGTSGADSYKVDVTTGQFGRIDSASTDYTNFTTSGSSTAAGNINSATISGMTITGTLSGTTNDVTMTVNNGTDNAVSFNISYGGASQIVTVNNAVANTTVSATVGGVTVSFSLDRSADNAVINTAAITLLDSSTTAQGTDQRITIDSTNDTTTGASGTVTLSSYANDASRTANSTLIADSAAVTQTFTTGTVNFTIGTAASLVNAETATLVTEGAAATEANNLKVLFNAKGTSFVTVTSIDTSSEWGLKVKGAISDWADGASITTALGELDKALSTLRDTGQTLATNLSVVQTREDFTADFINTLEEGSDKWTLADSNLEGANMLMLQTRQQLGTVSLSIASQAAQSILRLFG